jgi:hypothetical protein
MRKFSVLLLLCPVVLCSIGAFGQTGNSNYPESNLTPSYAADTGAANVLVVTLAPCPAALSVGDSFKVLPNHANTTTTPTLNVCGLGAKTITKFGQTALVASDLVTTAIAYLLYDGTDMELVNPNTATGSGSGSVSSVGQTINTASSSGIFAVTGSPVTGSGTLNINLSGTSGGVAYFSSPTVLSSSALLTQYGVLFGGGAAGAPTASAQGGSNFPLIGQSAANPIFSTIAYPTTCATGDLLYGTSATVLGCNTGIVASSGGIFTTYDGITTAGLGVPVIEGTLSDVTAQSASQSSVTLLTTASAGAYLVRYYIDQNATCSAPGPGQVYATFSWTDATHAHTAMTVPLNFLSALSTTGGYLQGAIPIYSATTSAITYTTTYAACTTGTATYDLHASVEQVR